MLITAQKTHNLEHLLLQVLSALCQAGLKLLRPLCSWAEGPSAKDPALKTPQNYVTKLSKASKGDERERHSDHAKCSSVVLAGHDTGAVLYFSGAATWSKMLSSRNSSVHICPSMYLDRGMEHALTEHPDKWCWLFSFSYFCLFFLFSAASFKCAKILVLLIMRYPNLTYLNRYKGLWRDNGHSTKPSGAKGVESTAPPDLPPTQQRPSQRSLSTCTIMTPTMSSSMEDT